MGQSVQKGGAGHVGPPLIVIYRKSERIDCGAWFAIDSA